MAWAAWLKMLAEMHQFGAIRSLHHLRGDPEDERRMVYVVRKIVLS
jgi:hypothetical protein